MERVFGSLALDELADLASDCRHHLEQISIRLPDLTAEKLDDTQDFPAKQNWKPKSCMQSFGHGNRRPFNISFLDKIGNVSGLRVEPNFTRQAYSGKEGPVAGGCLEFRDFYRLLMPKLDATQHTSLPVDAPERADIPFQGLT